jgi:hypothetical protein
MRHLTKDKGDLGVARTLPDLLEHGIRACLPLSEHLPFDLIAVMPDFTTLRRVQVKYRGMERGAVELEFKSNYYDSKRIYSKYVDLGELDVYAIFNPQADQVYYLRVNEVPSGRRAFKLRVEATNNGQQAGVHWAKNYIDPCRIAPQIKTVPPTLRLNTELDEIALDKAVGWLMGQEVQPCLAHSAYLPFDLVAVLPDMRTIKRVRVGCETVEWTPYADWFVVYDLSHQNCRLYESQALPADLIRKAVG